MRLMILFWILTTLTIPFISYWWCTDIGDWVYNPTLSDWEFINQKANAILWNKKKIYDKVNTIRTIYPNNKEQETKINTLFQKIHQIDSILESLCNKVKTDKEKTIRKLIGTYSQHECILCYDIFSYSWYNVRVWNMEQSITDAKWKSIPYTQLFPNMPKKITIWSLIYENPKLNFKGYEFEGSWTIYNILQNPLSSDSPNPLISFPYLYKKIALPIKNWLSIWYSTKSILLDKWWYSTFNGMHNEKFLLVDNKSYKITWAVWKIYPINNTVTTLKLLHIFPHICKKWDSDSGGYICSKIIDSVDYKDLPIFLYQPINELYSMVGINNTYMPSTPDGLGKPVVYVYDKLERKNWILLQLQTGNTLYYHTPWFTSKDNYRGFQSTTSWWMIVNNTYVPYLYYKLISNNLKYNTFGRNIKWDQIDAFFKFKLNEMGLNEQEIYDFTSYRSHKFDTKKYYFISFKVNSDLEAYYNLHFDIQPNEMYRVLMESTEITSHFTSGNYTIYSHRDDFIYPKVNRNNDLTVIERWWTLRWSNKYKSFIK